MVNVHCGHGQENPQDMASLSAKIRMTIPGEQMHVHRLSYMVSKRMHFDDIEGKDVSHLCHNTLCTNSDHLSLETHHINRTREICMNRNLCTGHGGYENCRLQLRL